MTMTVHAKTPIVHVVDDDVSIRESLELLIRVAGWTPALFDRAQAFLERAHDNAPGCVVLDLELPDIDGLELQERIAADAARLPVIFLTGHGDIAKTVRAMKGGAVEFFTKPFDVDQLLAAISRAIERSRAALEHAAALGLLRERHAGLTPREREVMALVVAGRLNKQVGAELGMSEVTVKAHRGQVMRKMRAASLADLVRIATSLELPLPPRV